MTLVKGDFIAIHSDAYFRQYTERLYGSSLTRSAEQDTDGSGDIESEIKSELAGMKKPASEPLFTHTRIPTQCRKFDHISTQVVPENVMQ